MTEIVLVLTSLVLAVNLASLCPGLIDVLRSPRAVTFPEGVTVHHIVRFASGEPLYTDFRTPPFLFTQYAPLYYVLCGSLARLLALQPPDVFILARSVSLLSFVITSLLVGLLVHRWRRSAAVSVLAALAFAHVGIAVGGGMVCAARPDLLACLLSLIGFCLFVEVDRVRQTYHATIPLVLAAYTKQSFLAAPITIVLVLVWRRRWRHASRWVALYGALAAGLFGLCEWRSGGGFSLNTVVGNAIPVDYRLPGLMLRLVMQTLLPLALLSATAMPRSEAARHALPYVLVSTLWAMLTTLKPGSSTSYYIEPAMALALLAGAQLAAGGPGFPARGVKLTPLAGVAVVLLACGLLAFRVGPVAGRPSASLELNPLEVFLAEHPPHGPVVSNVATPVVRQGLEVLMIDPVSFAWLEEAGHWDGTELRRWIAERRVAYVIVRRRPPVRWPQGFLEFMRRYYVLEATPSPRHLVYAPAPAPRRGRVRGHRLPRPR